MNFFQSRSIFVVFVISPLFAVFLSLVDGVKTFTKPILICFFFVIGYSMEIDPSTGADVIRIKEAFEKIVSVRDNPRVDFIEKITIDPDKPLEIMFGFIGYISSFITSHWKVFLGILSLIYGFFYVNILLFFIDLLNKKNMYFLSLVITYSLIHSPYAFQAFRFYSGAIIYIWVFIDSFLVKSKTNLLHIVLLIFTCFMHNAFFALFFLFIFKDLLVKNRIRTLWFVYNIFFILSRVVGFDLGALSDFLPEVLQSRTEVYSQGEEDNSVATSEPQLSWFLTWAYNIYHYFFFIFNNIIFYLANKYKREKELSIYMNFTLWLVAISCLFQTTEAYRYHIIAYQLVMLSLFSFFEENEIKSIISKIENIARWPLYFFGFILFRKMADFISLYMFILNPFLFKYIDKNFTIAKLYELIFK